MQIMRHILFDRLRISASIGGYQLVSEEPDIDPEQTSPDIGTGFGQARLNWSGSYFASWTRGCPFLC